MSTRSETAAPLGVWARLKVFGSVALGRVRAKLLAHVEMMRPYTLFHSGLVALAGAVVASGGTVAPWRAGLAAVVTMCGWEAGLYAGDYYDRDIDAASKPDRAIPSGRVSPREAFLTMCALIATGYAAALVLGPLNLVLAVMTTALGIAYSKTFKSRALLGNFDRGVLGVCAVSFGALAGGNLLSWPVALLAAMVLFHDSATNLVGAMRDVDGDRVAGCPTVPVVYGLERATWIVSALVAAWLVAAAALASLLGLNTTMAALFAVALIIAARVYVPLWLARKHVTRRQALSAHEYLVAERLVLLGAFVAWGTPPAVALAIVALALGGTLGSQVLLRERYEQQKLRPASAPGM